MLGITAAGGKRPDVKTSKTDQQPRPFRVADELRDTDAVDGGTVQHSPGSEKCSVAWQGMPTEQSPGGQEAQGGKPLKEQGLAEGLVGEGRRREAKE
eukprot:374587-Pleurochrysis_carterae.AAC.2